MTGLERLRAAAAPLLVAPRIVDSPDRADRLAWAQIAADCTALGVLDGELTDPLGAPGLAGALWMAAYARRPILAGANELAAGQRASWAICSAQLDSPEHDELRRSTVGDPYAAALAVLAQGPRLRQMLTAVDTASGRRDGRRAHREHTRALDVLRQALGDAEQDTLDGAGAADTDTAGDPDEADGGQVSRPRTVQVQRAVAEADATRAALVAVEAAGGGPGGDVAVVRADARASAGAAADELVAEAAAAAGWGSESGELQRMDPDARMALAQRLRSPGLARLAELIGRFRQTATAQRSRRVEHARGEYVGVTLGDELGGLVPDELVALAVPALRAQWAIRYADRQLMVYDQRGIDHEAQGSIIVVLDVSTSMTSYDTSTYTPGAGYITGEMYAKALALALLDSARAATPPRAFAVVPFCEIVCDAYQFPAEGPVDLTKKIEFAEFFPGGGTLFAPALDAAADLLDAEYNATGRARADIVIITDGAADLDDTWVEAWRERRRRLGFRLFAVTIGDWAEDPADLHRICDDVRALADLADTHATAALFRTL